MSDITDNIGLLLGRSPLSADEQKLAYLLAEKTQAKIDAAAVLRAVTLDTTVRDWVVAKAVASYLAKPRGALTQESVQVDDAQVVRSFAPSRDAGEIGEVEITADWWDELGMPQGGGSFSITPYYPPVPTDVW